MTRPDNHTLIQDPLTLLVVIANAPPCGVIVAPSSSSDAVFCIRSLRDDVVRDYRWGSNLSILKSKSTKFWYFHSWRAYARSQSIRPGAGWPVCTGCGKRISRHKP